VITRLLLPAVWGFVWIFVCALAEIAHAQTPAATAAATSATATTEVPPFDDWLEMVRADAVRQGISQATVDQALRDVELVPQIVERDRAQAEFTLSTDQYLRRRLTRDLVQSARQASKRHDPLLDRVQQAYDVQPRFVLAVWGLESNFGRFSGVRPMIPTLVTLAYEPRRATFFRQQLFDALRVVDRGYIDLDRLKGSWAGAMGQPQFMPSTYLSDAQDFDGDGRRDIWTSQPDVFASIAHYLKSRGWVPGETWGREVKVPARARTAIESKAPIRTAGCRAERQLTQPLPLSSWKALGVTRADGKPLPVAPLDASLLTTDSGTSYLVYRNFEVVLAYNCASTYALSVGLLADAIDGATLFPNDKPSKRKAAKRPTLKRPAKRAAPSRARTSASGTTSAPARSRPRPTRRGRPSRTRSRRGSCLPASRRAARRPAPSTAAPG